MKAAGRGEDDQTVVTYRKEEDESVTAAWQGGAVARRGGR